MSKKNSLHNEWKNGWKNGWKDPAFQKNENECYQYDRNADKSKLDIFKEAQKNKKSDYVNIRRKARDDINHILWPFILSAVLVIVVCLMLFQ